MDNSWVGVVVGLLFLAGGVALAFGWWNTTRRLHLVRATRTSPAGEVTSQRAGELVEVKGTLRCEAPLVSELSRQPCAYYASSLEREYEDYDRDSDDRSRRVRRSEKLASDERCVAFFVEDQSGTVQVAPKQAHVDAREVVNRFDEATALGPTIWLGAQSFTMGGSDTLGYRYRERVLPVDAPVYVLGVVNGDGQIAAPPREDGEQQFVISHQSEETLARSLGCQALLLGLFALVFTAAGVAVLVLMVRLAAQR